MQKYFDTVTDKRGNVVAGATVAVLNYPALTPAAIYSDNGITLIVGNEVTTDPNGRFEFYAADGRYSIEISDPTLTTTTINDILLEDPADANQQSVSALTVTTSLALSFLTAGSLLFAGAAGAVSQDNARLAWDAANQHLMVGPYSAFHDTQYSLSIWAKQSEGRSAFNLLSDKGVDPTTFTRASQWSNEAGTVSYGAVSLSSDELKFSAGNNMKLSLSTNGQELKLRVGTNGAITALSIDGTTGQLRATDGSATVPSYSFANRTGTGIFLGTGNTVGLRSDNGGFAGYVSISNNNGFGSLQLRDNAGVQAGALFEAGNITLATDANRSLVFTPNGTGQVLIGKTGSAAAPAIANSGGPGADTGIYFRSSGDRVHLAAGGFDVAAATDGNTFCLGLDTKLAWSSSATPGADDTFLMRDAADVIAQRNAANAQAFRLYNTFTDAANYERAVYSWQSNILRVGVEVAGTGVQRNIGFFTNGAYNWVIAGTTGHLLGNVDNTFDIGASGANRPRTIYAGTSFVTGGNSTTLISGGLYSVADNSTTALIGGNLLGGEVVCYGSTHATKPDQIEFRKDSTVKWKIATSTFHFLAETDNALDIGATGASRPRTGYFGTSVETPLIQNGTGTIALGNASGDIKWNKANVALGGGAAPTFGTIGGSGPAAAAQRNWLRYIESDGTASFIPVWR